MSETAMPDPVDAEFVTIAEAARRLGISDRQVRRWAGRLSDSDRKSDGRGGRLVRVAALNILRESAGVRSSGEEASPEVGRTSTGSRTPDADMSDRVTDRERLLREIVTRQEAEISHLRESLHRSQESERLALAALREEQSRSAVLLAAREMKQVGPAAQDAASASQTPESGAGEGRRGEGIPAKAPGFWAWLRGRGR